MPKLEVKLTDFGFATNFDKNLKDVLGSPYYMPPEIIMEDHYDSKVDIWSAGIVAFQILSGKLPFNGDSKNEVYT